MTPEQRAARMAEIDTNVAIEERMLGGAVRIALDLAEHPGGRAVRTCAEHDVTDYMQRGREDRTYLLAEVRRLEGEQYWDLIEQAQEVWPPGCQLYRDEVIAFLESRATHRPTQTLREEAKHWERIAKIHERGTAGIECQCTPVCDPCKAAKEMG